MRTTEGVGFLDQNLNACLFEAEPALPQPLKEGDSWPFGEALVDASLPR